MLVPMEGGSEAAPHHGQPDLARGLRGGRANLLRCGLSHCRCPDAGDTEKLSSGFHAFLSNAGTVNCSPFLSADWCATSMLATSFANRLPAGFFSSLRITRGSPQPRHETLTMRSPVTPNMKAVVCVG